MDLRTPSKFNYSEATMTTDEELEGLEGTEGAGEEGTGGGEWKPSWDLSQKQEDDAPGQLTEAKIGAMISSAIAAALEARQETNPDFEEEIANKVTQRVREATRSEFAQIIEQTTAPTLRNEIVREITNGFGKEASKVVSTYLQKYNLVGLQNLMQDEVGLSALRALAKEEDAKANKKAPTSEKSGVARGGNIDNRTSSDIDRAYQSMKQQIPGLKREDMERIFTGGEANG
jgi:hypothetical protein